MSMISTQFSFLFRIVTILLLHFRKVRIKQTIHTCKEPYTLFRIIVKII